MSTGLIDPWDIKVDDVILELNNRGPKIELHRYRVREVPKVDWPNAATAVQCEENGLAINFILQHDERVLVSRYNERIHTQRRAAARRREMQGR